MDGGWNNSPLHAQYDWGSKGKIIVIALGKSVFVHRTS